MKAFFSIVLGFTASVIFGQESKVDLKVKINGFKNNNGKVIVGLYNSEGNFLNTTHKATTTIIKRNTAYVVFKGIHKGEYAISLYHDENNNNELDKNFFGIPKEVYGCSNNAKGVMGPPQYKDAKFKLVKTETITISL